MTPALNGKMLPLSTVKYAERSTASALNVEALPLSTVKYSRPQRYYGICQGIYKILPPRAAENKKRPHRRRSVRPSARPFTPTAVPFCSFFLVQQNVLGAQRIRALTSGSAGYRAGYLILRYCVSSLGTERSPNAYFRITGLHLFYTF